MKIASIEMDGRVYIVGDSGMEFQSFNEGSEFHSFLKKAVDGAGGNSTPLISAILSGRPKLHDMPKDESIFDIIEEQTEVVIVADKDTGVPLLSLILCDGAGSKAWRESGEDVIGESGPLSFYESPELKSKKILSYPFLPQGAIH